MEGQEDPDPPLDGEGCPKEGHIGGDNAQAILVKSRHGAVNTAMGGSVARGRVTVRRPVNL